MHPIVLSVNLSDPTTGVDICIVQTMKDRRSVWNVFNNIHYFCVMFAWKTLPKVKCIISAPLVAPDTLHLQQDLSSTQNYSCDIWPPLSAGSQQYTHKWSVHFCDTNLWGNIEVYKDLHSHKMSLPVSMHSHVFANKILMCVGVSVEREINMLNYSSSCWS